MAVLDTHKAFEHLTAAGYSKEMAEALLDTLGNSQDTLATKADLNELAQMTKADLNELAQTTKTNLRELELRMTVKVGAMLFAVAGLLVALELIPR